MPRCAQLAASETRQQQLKRPQQPTLPLNKQQHQAGLELT
jgi:hypothetical protein